MSTTVSFEDLHPRLVVRGAQDAIEFYRTALDAEVTEKLAEDTGRIVHARLDFGAFHLSLTEEVVEWSLLSPSSLGGSPLLLHLSCDDCDALAARMIEHGAETIIPIADRPYGKREGRLRDPFGHLWIPSTHLFEISS